MINYRLLFSILALTVIMSSCFPLRKLKTYTPGIISSSTFLLDSLIEIEGDSTILYTSMISTNLQNFAVHRVNASTTPPTFLASFGKSFSGLTKMPKVNLMKSMFSVIWGDVSGDKGCIVMKSSMQLVEDNFDTYNSYAGLFLPNIDTVFMHGTTEYAVTSPEGQDITISSYYTSNTSAPLKIKTFSTKSYDKVYTFYSDRNFFAYRPVTTKDDMVKEYASPVEVTFG